MGALTFGSLFAGIGGLDLGLERAGMACRWQVEIDEYCRRVLAKHWPDVPKFGDIREVTGGELERVDLICGGFPCQDISDAGKRAGIGGERSGLWSEYIRLVRVLRPHFVLVENVAALLGRGAGTVLGDLAASGYDAEWDCIPAAAVGAPHIRDRVFIVAHARCVQGGERHNADRERGRQDEAEQTRVGGGAVAHADRAGSPHLRQSQARGERLTGRDTPARGGDRAGTVADPDRQSLAVGPCFGGDAREELATFERSCRAGQGQWATEPDVGRVADGVPARVDRLRGLGNAVVPQIAEWLGRRIVEAAS
jgi:DNA (cytosine-5)-methyltransferase 1